MEFSHREETKKRFGAFYIGGGGGKLGVTRKDSGVKRSSHELIDGNGAAWKEKERGSWWKRVRRAWREKVDQYQAKRSPPTELSHLYPLSLSLSLSFSPYRLGQNDTS